MAAAAASQRKMQSNGSIISVCVMTARMAMKLSSGSISAMWQWRNGMAIMWQQLNQRRMKKRMA